MMRKCLSRAHRRNEMNLHTLSAAAAFAALLFCPRPAASQDQQVFPDPMVTFHAERQSLRSILELMAEEAKLKIDFTDRALKVANQGTVSASLENVPFSRALASILRAGRADGQQLSYSR